MEGFRAIAPFFLSFDVQKAWDHGMNLCGERHMYENKRCWTNLRGAMVQDHVSEGQVEASFVHIDRFRMCLSEMFQQCWSMYKYSFFIIDSLQRGNAQTRSAQCLVFPIRFCCESK